MTIDLSAYDKYLTMTDMGHILVLPKTPKEKQAELAEIDKEYFLIYEEHLLVFPSDQH